jgi:hypothetical protein
VVDPVLTIRRLIVGYLTLPGCGSVTVTGTTTSGGAGVN